MNGGFKDRWLNQLADAGVEMFSCRVGIQPTSVQPSLSFESSQTYSYLDGLVEQSKQPTEKSWATNEIRSRADWLTTSRASNYTMAAIKTGRSTNRHSAALLSESVPTPTSAPSCPGDDTDG